MNINFVSQRRPVSWEAGRHVKLLHLPRSFRTNNTHAPSGTVQRAEVPSALPSLDLRQSLNLPSLRFLFLPQLLVPQTIRLGLDLHIGNVRVAF